MPHETAVYVVCVMFVATLVRSALGFGEALVAVPLLALRVPVAVAAPLAVAASVVVAALVVARDRRDVEVRGALGLLAAAAAGIPVGLWLVARVDDRPMRAGLGVLIVAFSAYSLTAGSARHLPRDRWPWLLACGFCSGVMGGAYGMNGPPLAVYGALRRWSPRQFRATLQAYFLPASLLGLGGFVAAGLWPPAVTRYGLLCLPAVLAATAAGRALNRRLPADRFARGVHVGLIVLGAALLAQVV